jgi:hypothetical protein
VIRALCGAKDDPLWRGGQAQPSHHFLREPVAALRESVESEFSEARRFFLRLEFLSRRERHSATGKIGDSLRLARGVLFASAQQVVSRDTIFL